MCVCVFNENVLYHKKKRKRNKRQKTNKKTIVVLKRFDVMHWFV